jgi:hypothetical protein
MKVRIVVICVMTVCTLEGGYQYFREKLIASIIRVEDEGYKFLQNVDNHLQEYVVS